jgi:lysophospholipase L1-like esterase
MKSALRGWLGPAVMAAFLTMAVGSLWVRVRREDFGVISGLLLLLAVGLLVALLVELAMRWLGAASATRSKVRLLLAACAVTLLGGELLLRFGTEAFATYGERNGERYVGVYSPDPRRYRDYTGVEVVTVEKTEFTHSRRVNALGLTGDLPPLEKAPDEYRIIGLGDSFTEGVGADVDSTWLEVVERNLARRHPERRISTLNGGISGNDPFYEYVLLEDKLLPYRPDLVVIAVNTSDVSDILVRGGAERFLADGTVAYRKPPRWEPLYALSFLTRGLLQGALRYDWLLMPKSELPRAERAAADSIAASLDELRALCRKHSSDLLVVFHPMAFQVQAGRYDRSGFPELVQAQEREWGPRAMDLMAVYLERGVMTRDGAGDFYWPSDLHHNAKGYQAMGDAIADRIEELGVLQPR